MGCGLARLDRRGLGGWLPVGAVVALLGAAMLAAVYANPVIDNLPPVTPPGATADAMEQPTFSRPPTAEPIMSLKPPTPGFTLPSWVTWVLTGLCVASVLALIVALLWASLRDRLGEKKTDLKVVDAAVAEQAARARIRAAVDEGLAELDDADLDPRRAVIACWVRLEAAAAAAGTPREPGDTSTELVGRLLSSHAVSGDVLADFAEVYRQARFASQAVDSGRREQARAALRQLRDELTAGPVRPAGAAT